MVGAHQHLNASCDLSTPFQRRFAIRGLALVTVNLLPRFVASIFTYYDDMKGDTKCRKWGGLG